MIQSQISQDQSVEILDRLAQDNAFRHAFQVDPGNALRSLGVDVGDIGAISVPTTEEAELVLNNLNASRKRDVPDEMCGVPMPMWPIFTARRPKNRIN